MEDLRQRGERDAVVDLRFREQIVVRLPSGSGGARGLGAAGVAVDGLDRAARGRGAHGAQISIAVQVRSGGQVAQSPHMNPQDHAPPLTSTHSAYVPSGPAGQSR